MQGKVEGYQQSRLAGISLTSQKQSHRVRTVDHYGLDIQNSFFGENK